MNPGTVILCDPSLPELADRLAGLGLEVLVVPDLYYLPADHAVWRRLAELPAPLLVAGLYYGRAMHWLLAERGLEATGVDLTGCDAGQAVDRVIQAVPAAAAGPGKVEDLRQGPTADRWYPVIDYARCSGCLDCVEFCLFGVYDLDQTSRPVVAQPDRCKPGCPACSRVCPSAAIMFPRYIHRGPIAGDSAGRPEHLQGQDARAAAKTDIQAHHAATGQPPAPVQINLPSAHPAKPADKLDQVIADLEDFTA